MRLLAKILLIMKRRFYYANCYVSRFEKLKTEESKDKKCYLPELDDYSAPFSCDCCPYRDDSDKCQNIIHYFGKKWKKQADEYMSKK